jgi:hypothetical protein
VQKGFIDETPCSRPKLVDGSENRCFFIVDEKDLLALRLAVERLPMLHTGQITHPPGIAYTGGIGIGKRASHHVFPNGRSLPNRWTPAVRRSFSDR